MKVLIIVMLILILLLLFKRKTGGLKYVYQLPSPFGLYSERDCLVACSKNDQQACDWCKTKTLMME